jgi:murein DD-endopeptidase MepM/ murein hydrolase activator NlpD
MQSVCWLSSFSLLGNGLVFAQTESAIDNIVPTTTNTQPVSAKSTLDKDIVIQSTSVVASPSNPQKSNFAQRRARLRQVLKHKTASSSQPNNESASQPVVAAKKPKAQVGVNVSPPTATKTTPSKPEITIEANTPAKASQPTTAVREENTPAVSNEPATSAQQADRTTPSKSTDYNNAYIDPTDYNSAAKRNYQAPNAVILTERGTGCQAVLGKAGVTNSSCVNAPVSNPSNQNLGNSQHKLTTAKAPSWLRKSQNSPIANVAPIRPAVVARAENRRWNPNQVVAAAVTNRWNPNQTAGSVTKNSLRTHRFIPSPSSFTATEVSSTPIAPKGGILALPMTAENIAPRVSTVAYNIPLASTLPKIAYGVANIAYNGTGFIFPVSVPSPITSLFGWRTHPITGDRRFHAGTDIGAAMGTPVLAAETGTVEVADWVGGYGMTVILNHGNTQQTLYGHMSEIMVQPGQKIERGMVIGRVGSTGNSTGPHLHFEVRQLTSEGWVATNPNGYLESGLQQLTQSLQTAQRPE